jgi:hypothetical protein
MGFGALRVINDDTIQFVLGLLSEQKNFRLDITLLLAAVVVDMLLTLWQVVSK